MATAMTTGFGFFGVVFGLDFDLPLAFAVEVLVVVVFFVAPVAMLPTMA
jgi:hypothetical protein